MAASLSFIDAVKEMCKLWGLQKQRMLHDINQGWPGFSTIVKFKEMWDGAASGTQKVSQFMEEAHYGDGLLVARALHGAPEDINVVVFAHYVARGKAKQKAHLMGISVAEYWRQLECAHYWIAAKLPVVETTVETKKAS